MPIQQRHNDHKEGGNGSGEKKMGGQKQVVRLGRSKNKAMRKIGGRGRAEQKGLSNHQGER